MLSLWDWNAAPVRTERRSEHRGGPGSSGPPGPGDALKVVGEPQLTLEGGRDAEVLVFDLP